MIFKIKRSRSRKKKNAPVKERTNHAIFRPNESIWTVDLSAGALELAGLAQWRRRHAATVRLTEEKARRQKRNPNNSHTYIYWPSAASLKVKIK
jgi:hypothetical protein